MEKKERDLRFLPIGGYLAFFLMYVILGLLLISGILPPNSIGLTDQPMYQPLVYVDLLILLAMNIPTFVIIALAMKRSGKAIGDTSTE